MEKAIEPFLVSNVSTHWALGTHEILKAACDLRVESGQQTFTRNVGKMRSRRPWLECQGRHFVSAVLHMGSASLCRHMILHALSMSVILVVLLWRYFFRKWLSKVFNVIGVARSECLLFGGGVLLCLSMHPDWEGFLRQPFLKLSPFCFLPRTCQISENIELTIQETFLCFFCLVFLLLYLFTYYFYSNYSLVFHISFLIFTQFHSIPISSTVLFVMTAWLSFSKLVPACWCHVLKQCPVMFCGSRSAYWRHWYRVLSPSGTSLLPDLRLKPHQWPICLLFPLLSSSSLFPCPLPSTGNHGPCISGVGDHAGQTLESWRLIIFFYVPHLVPPLSQASVILVHNWWKS